MKLKSKNGKEYIYDVIRKKYILNQPEEWVRQNIIQYLHIQKGYPISLMAIEKKTTINNRPKRSDLICYNNHGNAILLVECKAPNVQLNMDTFNQTMNYQKIVQAKYMMVTNGKTHYCFISKRNKIEFLKNIPNYKKI